MVKKRGVYNKEQLDTFPKLRCENCGHDNILFFDVRTSWASLKDVICESCKKKAYWTFYFKSAGEMILHFLLRLHHQPQEKIFAPFIGKNHGHKKPKSKSI